MASFSPARYLALAAFILAWIVVSVGAYTRLKDAGLSCPDWPTCYGQLTVPQAHEEAQAEQAYPGQPLEAHKAWIEMIHRYLAGSLGIAVLALAILASYLSWPKNVRYLAWSIVPLIVFQALLGMWTVTLGLHPWIVTAHLLGGLSTLALLGALTLRLYAPSPSPINSNHSSSLPYWVIGGFVILALQIILGGLTSAHYAGLVCTSFPICQVDWWSMLNLPQAFAWLPEPSTNYQYGVLEFEARMTIHVLHRLGAIVTTFYFVLLSTMLWRAQRSGAAMALCAALIVQLSLGISNIVAHLPTWLAVAHNIGASALLLTLVYIHFTLRRFANS